MKRRKLFYIPGLISIIGLPILLYFFNTDHTVRPTCVSMGLLTDKKDEPGISIFSKDRFYSLIRHKKIISVDLTEFLPYDPDKFNNSPDLVSEQLNFISREMEKLQFTHDTSTVLKVAFGNDNTYGQWMQVRNKAAKYRIRRYVFVDDCFFFIFDTPPIHHPSLESYTREFIELQIHEPSKWKIFMSNLRYQCGEALFILKVNHMYVIGFILLISIPGIRLIVHPPARRKLIAASPNFIPPANS